MLLGRTLRLLFGILFGRTDETPSSPNEYIKNLEARLESVHAFARERIKLAIGQMKPHYDSRATNHHFKGGDTVWMYNPKRRRGLSQVTTELGRAVYYCQETQRCSLQSTEVTQRQAKNHPY
ncbi:hypothetical protein AVEN_88551-1 [Araneus ventricosus]|uniref:Uncharacterized protein n=1 Tax=Araneus ventricosus TaxID=182803 RepID=A0A4Y2KL15_ARAVE|nr:hypothetical protein AVEN_88551-1 [Araneus ventricosus]